MISQKETTRTQTLLKFTACLYRNPNIRARSRSTLIAVIVSKVTPHKIALVGLMSN